MTEQMTDVLIKQAKPVHENELNAMIYNIAHTVATSMGVTFESIQEGVLRLSSELVDSVIMNEIKYDEQITRKSQKTGKKGINYDRDHRPP